MRTGIFAGSLCVLVWGASASGQVMHGTYSTQFGSQPAGGRVPSVVAPYATNSAPFGYYNPYGPVAPYGFVVYNPFVGYPYYRGYRAYGPVPKRQVVVAPPYATYVAPRVAPRKPGGPPRW